MEMWVKVLSAQETDLTNIKWALEARE